jgi:hypothetical protein
MTGDRFQVGEGKFSLYRPGETGFVVRPYLFETFTMDSFIGVNLREREAVYLLLILCQML